MPARPDAAPWVIVAGGVHRLGGMDRANAALATHLLARGVPVHLVAHDVDPQMAADPAVTVHRVPRPRGTPALAERLLARAGRRVARMVTAEHPGARVVVNGGNCSWPDINWVHALHAAWPVHDEGAPWWWRYRLRRLKHEARRRERVALDAARLVIANSRATARDVVHHVGVPPERVQTVYLGADAGAPADRQARTAARAALGLTPHAPLVAFVGALGADTNKGFDVLWAAWQQLARGGGWDAHLVVAGSGWRLAGWREDARRSPAAGTVRFLGFSPDVPHLLAASDLLVSPVRYEAYGLNVQEALCCGAAVMVTRTAGIAERFDEEMREALLPPGVTTDVLADRLRAWRRDVDGWKRRAAGTAARLRARTWDDMARDIVSAAGVRRRVMTA